MLTWWHVKLSGTCQSVDPVFLNRRSSRLARWNRTSQSSVFQLWFTLVNHSNRVQILKHLHVSVFQVSIPGSMCKYLTTSPFTLKLILQSPSLFYICFCLPSCVVVFFVLLEGRSLLHPSRFLLRYTVTKNSSHECRHSSSIDYFYMTTAGVPSSSAVFIWTTTVVCSVSLHSKVVTMHSFVGLMKLSKVFVYSCWFDENFTVSSYSVVTVDYKVWRHLSFDNRYAIVFIVVTVVAWRNRSNIIELKKDLVNRLTSHYSGDNVYVSDSDSSSK